ncbi:hypothetical protein DITRI_Ditri05aG0012000 [Diplodiscus trichospermus]
MEKKQNLAEDGATIEDGPPLEKEHKSEEDGATIEGRPPIEKKQKVEGDDDFFVPYYDNETYLKKFNDHSLDDEDAVATDEEERDFTEEEAKIYYDAVEASDRFDVPEFPGVSRWGLILPMSVDEDSLEYLLPSTEAAIKTYNYNYHTDYKVVQVLKAMQEAAARGINRYITFLAKYSTTKTFEAKVLKGIPKEKGDDATEVIFCREKGAKEVAAKEEVSRSGTPHINSRSDFSTENEYGEGGSVEDEEVKDEPKYGLDSSSSQLLLKALRPEALDAVNVFAWSFTCQDYFIDILEGIIKLNTSIGLTTKQLPVRWMLHNGYPVPMDMLNTVEA